MAVEGKKTYHLPMSNRDDMERMLNTPMRWYHKLPYWIVLGLIVYGVGKLFGLF